MELLDSSPGSGSGSPTAGYYLGPETHRRPMKPRKLDFSAHEDGHNSSPPAAYYSDRDENMYSSVLRNELGGDEHASNASSPAGSPLAKNILNYSLSPTKMQGAQFSLSPMSKSSQKLLECPRSAPRTIPKAPIKCLEAPSIQDDFYLNLVDWSAQNVVAVALATSVYLWNASTASVHRLCDLGVEQVTSVSWAERGTQLAVGSSAGTVHLWDATKGQRVRELSGHRQRVCAISWNRDLLASGSRDRSILFRDSRMSESISRFVGHKQEVCGLRWSPDGNLLASGGNDNKLLIWDPASHAQPLHKLCEHAAAVKAIAWSPHQRSLLASGGGTVDRTIRMWNISGDTPHRSLMCIDTGSQVCNLAWSKNVNELVSTHGYSQNQVVVWSYPAMTPIATLTGHTMRVLFLAVSPDGQMIVTGAGDETLRLWSVFPGSRGSATSEHISSLSPTEIR